MSDQSLLSQAFTPCSQHAIAVAAYVRKDGKGYLAEEKDLYSRLNSECEECAARTRLKATILARIEGMKPIRPSTAGEQCRLFRWRYQNRYFHHNCEEVTLQYGMKGKHKRDGQCCWVKALETWEKGALSWGKLVGRRHPSISQGL